MVEPLTLAPRSRADIAPIASRDQWPSVFLWRLFAIVSLWKSSAVSIHHLASNESIDCNILSGAAQSSVKSSDGVTEFSSSRRHRCRLRSSSQDVVLRARSARAEGFGGVGVLWQGCSQPSLHTAAVCRGKIPDRKTQSILDDRNNYLFTSSTHLSDLVFFVRFCLLPGKSESWTSWMNKTKRLIDSQLFVSGLISR